MKNCEWKSYDCKFLGTSHCDTCFTYNQNYVEKEKKKIKSLAKRQQKQDKRQGSYFEYKNHKRNDNILKDDIVSNMTLNSGATVLEKGDEQIRGLINIMEELKTKTKEQAPGKKSFTIQEKWLSKLRREALAEGMDFYYLKFSFYELDQDVYIIVEENQIMSMVKTMVEDRRKVKLCELNMAEIQKELEVKRAENLTLNSKIELLEAKNKKLELKLKQLEDKNYV